MEVASEHGAGGPFGEAHLLGVEVHEGADRGAQELPEADAPVPPTIDEENRLVAIGAWFSQAIHAKQPKQDTTRISEKYGAWEGVCRWHAKSRRTGCKKLFAIGGPDEAHRVLALRRCQWWLAQCTTVTRQWEHLYLTDFANPPPLSVIEARVPRDPPAHVVSDEDFARAQAEGDDAPRAKAKAKGKGKAKAKAAKAKAKPAQKGRGKANREARWHDM